MGTSVPAPTLGPTGFTAPDDATILAAVLADLNAAFGGGLNLNLSTPQGQLASTLAAIISDNDALFCQYVAQVDPQYAQGRMQDAVGNLYFLTRLPATSTLVQCTCTGLAGTVIPAGALAADSSGNIYAAVSGGTIPVGGTITLAFANQVTGPVPCAAGTLTSIYVAIPGWDTITNPAAGVLGQNAETAQQFEYRRQNSVAANANGVVPSVFAAIMASGAGLGLAPTDAYVVENNTGSPSTVNGVSLLPNSIYIAVAGGDPASIATAIWSKLSAGCGFTPTAQFTGSIAGAVLTVSAVASGFLALGQTVSGLGIPKGTTISSLGTGAGGVGTYNLSSNVGTVASESMTSATVVTVYDSNYAPPQPAYPIAYTVPQATPINFVVQLSNTPNLPANIATLVTNALQAAFAGTDGGSKLRIGSTVYASRFYAGIMAAAPGVQVEGLFVGTGGSPTATLQQLNMNQIATLGTVSVSVLTP